MVAAKASIIISVFNGMLTISRALESALNQTEKDIEIIIVDDASSDGTADFVASCILKDPRIKLIKLRENVGAAAATNIAFERASSPWVAILDADDWFEPRRIERLLRAANSYQADAVFDNLRIFDHARGYVIEKTQYGAKNRAVPLNAETYFWRDNPMRRHSMGYSKPMFRKKFLTANKLAYNPVYRVGYDFLLLTEVLLCGGRVIILPEADYGYVHMYSPTTRHKSPSSHTKPSYDQLIRACDNLLEKYPNMKPDEHAALVRRRRIFESRVHCDELRSVVREGRVGEGMRMIWQDPLILIMVASTLIRLCYANILVFCRSKSL